MLITVLAVLTGALYSVNFPSAVLLLQQAGYGGARYVSVLKEKQKEKPRKREAVFCFLLVFGLIFPLVFGKNFRFFYAAAAGLIFSLFISLFKKADKKKKAKLPLTYTPRVWRLFIACATLSLLFHLGSAWGLFYLYSRVSGTWKNLAGGTLIVLWSLAGIFSERALAGVNACISPLEKRINARYLKKAKKTLDAFTGIKIGITGSFGKTGVKEILKSVLSVRYRVTATPASFNTPLGVARTVNAGLTGDVFLCEMGARKAGDISELCALVKPTMGVLTGINRQHLESFGSVSAIEDGKYELFSSLPADGVGFFNVATAGAKRLFDRYGGEKYAVAGEGACLTAVDVRTGEDGVAFTLIKGKESVACAMPLLGTGAVENACLSAAVAVKLGLTLSEIAWGLSLVKPVPHRLELKKGKGLTVIDDGYNANETGAHAALDTLSLFQGRKVVITPGIVEGGADAYDVNKSLGLAIAKAADVLVITAKVNKDALSGGYLFGGGKVLYTLKNTRDQSALKAILKEGDVVLFENDLPDVYE